MLPRLFHTLGPSEVLSTLPGTPTAQPPVPTNELPSPDDTQREKHLVRDFSAPPASTDLLCAPRSYLSPTPQHHLYLGLITRLNSSQKRLQLFSGIGPKQRRKGSDLLFSASPCPNTWVSTRHFPMGSRESEATARGVVSAKGLSHGQSNDERRWPKGRH